MAFPPSYQPGYPVCGPSHAEFVDSPNGWLQPSLISWSIENRPNLVRFGETSGNVRWGIPRPKLRCTKRKLDLDTNPTPLKFHVTEDKMADQLKNMHISNNFMSHKGFEDDLDSPDGLLPSLSLSKEVQNLPTLTQTLIPEPLIENMEKPTRALVLWKPPSGSLTTKLIQKLRNKTDDKTANANNNTSTADLNTVPTMCVNQCTEMEL